MAPRKRSRAASISAAVTATGRSSSTSPSASPVLVRRPSSSVARYSLSASSSGPANLVASPNSTMSNPDASGSSVPAWPAFFARASRFASCSAAFELRPTGLSRSSAPSLILLFVFRVGGVDQSREPVAALDRHVVFEAQLRRGVELDALRELRAQEAGRALQALGRLVDVRR